MSCVSLSRVSSALNKATDGEDIATSANATHTERQPAHATTTHGRATNARVSLL